MTSRSDKSLAFTYDNSNQVTEASRSGRVIQQNSYNSEGKRYKKVENGRETYYYYVGETLLYEESNDGTQINYIYFNGKQIAKVETKNGTRNTYYYFTDHLGSTRAVMGYDGKLIGTVYYEPFGDEKPYFPGRDASYPQQSSLEKTSDITGRVSGTLELTSDRKEGNYALLAKIGDDPYDFTNVGLSSEYQGIMDSEEARYYHIWAKPETGAEWLYVVFDDQDDPARSYEQLCPDDHDIRYRVGKELKANEWNLILLDLREGMYDGINHNTSGLRLFTDEYSQWKWDYFGVSVKDPVTFTGKQQDDTTGLYYFNARYYDPDLGRFITEDPVRDGANWYVYCYNSPLKYVDESGKTPDVLDVGFAIWSYYDLINDPSLANVGWAMLDTASLLPVIPSSGYWRRGAQIGGKADNIIHFGTKVDDVISFGRTVDIVVKDYGNLMFAAQYGIDSHKNLIKTLKGTGLQAHHIIEKRFAKFLGITDTSLMKSVALSKEEHQLFTNAWRSLIPYGTDYLALGKEAIWDAAKIIYSSYPELLEQARKTLFK